MVITCDEKIILEEIFLKKNGVILILRNKKY